MTARTARRESDYSRPTVKRRGMRTGYTTGACAAAAAKAAALALLSGQPVREATLRLPIGEDAAFAIHHCELLPPEDGPDGVAAAPAAAICSVIKDGGDDPDVTSGSEIRAKVWAAAAPSDAVDAPNAHNAPDAVDAAGASDASEHSPAPSVTLRGGSGVGAVTKPGTGIPVGDPSITRVPRRMITQAVIDAAKSVGCETASFIVEISVPGGEEIAKKTDNPRLGIVGGISILGTTGVVQPFSTAAWRASVNVSIDVAAANAIPHMVIATGTQSELFAKRMLELPDMAYVNVGIFTGAALRRCVQRGVPRAALVGMVGKFSKIAMGKFVTHVAGNKVDPAYLAALAAECGASNAVQDEMRAATSGRHFQEIALERGVDSVFDLLCARVCQAAREYLGDRADTLAIDAVCFDFDGAPLGRATTSAQPLPLRRAAAPAPDA